MNKDWKQALGGLFENMPKDPNGDNTYEEPLEVEEDWKPSKDTVYIYKDSKRRKGKVVTIIEGIDAPEEELEKILKCQGKLIERLFNIFLYRCGRVWMFFG